MSGRGNFKRDRRGHFRGRHHNRDFGGTSRDNSGSRDRHTQRHPPHLKGREIGLFYAKRSNAKKAEMMGRPLGAILLSESKKTQIQSALDSNQQKQFIASNTNNYDQVEDSKFKRNFMRIIGESIGDNLNKASINLKRNSQADEMLYEQHKSKQSDPRYIQMIAQRKKLPAYDMRNKILEIINENQIVVISGETGCGKTTQVAQFILDDYIENKKGSICRIVCTQPRRISAISVAERVADERCEKLGNSVGYHIRLEHQLPRDRGSVVFCTTGVVLKQMETDPSLSNVSHLILDEIHERDVMSDFILALIKQVLTKRNDLKVILMSATLNSEKFSRYYNNAPHLNIPGFTYPVTEYYLEDVIERLNFVFEEKETSKKFRGRKKAEKKLSEFSQFIEPHVRLLEAEQKYSRNVCIQLRNPKSEELNMELMLALLIDICQKEKDEGAILVFVTGYSDISKLTQLIHESGRFPSHKYRIFPLHSLMPTIDQKQIFERPPQGIRKIVIATNIAETSITIDDVVFVIDCGRIKISNFDIETNSQTLNAEWVALANASQRKGRAGRVQPGICFHLYSKAREMMLEQYQKPEILRKRLEDVILTAKILQLGKVEAFFATLLDPPDPEAVDLSLTLLKQLNALNEDDESLTPLGYHLAKLPMAPQMGKMILFGAIFSCLDPILSVAATLDFKEPFQMPLGKEREVAEMKLELANGTKSDHLLFHEAISQYERHRNDARSFCWRYFLSSHTLQMLIDMKKQFAEYLLEMNFVPDNNPKSEACNRNSHNLSLVKAIICAGLYPNVAISKSPGKMPKFSMDMRKKFKMHPRSVLDGERHCPSNLLVYYKTIKSSSEFIHDATLVYPLSVVFFGDKLQEQMDNGHNIIAVRDHLRFKCTQSTSAIIKELRNRFNWFLEYKISHPGPVSWTGNSDETSILEIIMELITTEDLDQYDIEDFEDYD